MGVDPDIMIKQAKIEELDDDFEIKESQLKKHLEAELDKIDGNGKVKKEEPKKEEPKKEEVDKKTVLTAEDVKKDYQLRNAISILRALIIVR